MIHTQILDMALTQINFILVQYFQIETVSFLLKVLRSKICLREMNFSVRITWIIKILHTFNELQSEFDQFFFFRPSNILQKYGSQVASFLEARIKFLSCFVYKSLALIILEKVSERVSRSIWSVYYSLMKKTRCVCLVGEAS